jgi:type I restriction enzyme S subunit
VLDGFSSGMTPYRGNPDFYKGDIPWITSGELIYNIIKDTFEKITESAVIKTNLKILPVGTFLMAITGLEAEGTRGRCGITGIKATTNQSCMALFPKTGKITTKYLYYYYIRYGNEYALKYCQGTKQQSYTGKIVKILPINLPPTLAEQEAIAEVLSDTDALITTLEKRIAKKRNIKQGTMQKLLKPKVGWEVKKLGDLIVEIADGGTPSTANQNNFGGKIYWVVINDIKDKIYSTTKTLTNLGLKNSSSRLWKPETIILSTGATIGEVGITKVYTATKQGICGIVVKENVSNLFLKYWFVRNKNLLRHVAQGSSIKELRPPTLIQFDILIPSFEEQTCIATILSDMDNEIDALEKKLSKIKELKQGLMQQLLTGKIRLA